MANPLSRAKVVPWLALNVCACGLWVLASRNQDGAQGLCINNLKHLAEANLLYAMDHDGHLPSATSWADATRSYVGDENRYRCPAPENDFLGFGHAFADALSGFDVFKVSRFEPTVLIFDSSRIGWNAYGGSSSVVHTRRANAAYIDGSARQLDWDELPLWR